MELYNKYRPQTFEEIRGNDLAVKSIKSELDKGSHVFLLTGSGGCGKTTIARVAAKYLGANDLSIREINSSENRGIDSVREIMEEIRYAPLDGGKLVYILDEMHQQTGASQNALLKVLEECPSWCVFFLATTNPEKLIQPLKTRCSIINMKPLNHEDMLKLLRIVTRREGATIDVGVLSKVADLSEGSSRQGLKILSSIIGLENDEERSKFLETNTFTSDNPQTLDLCRALMNREGWAKYMECLEKLKGEVTSNAEGIRQAVMGYALAVLKKGKNPVAVALLQTFSNQDAYRNGKFAIYVALLDFEDYLAG